MMNLSWNILSVASLLIGAVSAMDCPGSKTPPLEIRDKRFYDSSNGQYVPIKGIAYYPRPNGGPLSEGNSVDFYTDDFEARWREDIGNLKDLGVNAVRLYAVDPSKNHDNFMCALQEAGIYVMLGLLADCEDCGIGAWVGVDAEPPLCYTPTVKERGKFVIRAFSRYDNLLAFSAGNEVSIYADDGEGGPREANVPCQKKFLRDMREYVDGCAGGGLLPRKVPIGLVNWDGRSRSFEQHVHYHCRTDPDDLFENTEWFALNSYRQCDGSATSRDEIVGWPELLEDFKTANFPGPVLFGEYGCREHGFPEIDGWETQRTWYQAEALYTPKYSTVFSGGFVFEYSAEKKVVDDNLQWLADRNTNGIPTSEWPYQKFAKVNYGIGYFGPSDCEHDDGSDDFAGTPCQYSRYPEWDGLVNVYARSDQFNVRDQSPGVLPACPERFQPLSFYDWPTDEEEDPDLAYCLELQKTGAPTTAAPVTPPTKAPTAAPNDDGPGATDVPTNPPSESIAKPVSTLSPTAIPTILTGPGIISPTFPPTPPPTLPPTLSPTVPPNSSRTSTPTFVPTISPTLTPNSSPTASPSAKPTVPPTTAPSATIKLSSTTSPSVTLVSSKTPSPSVTLAPTAEIFEVESTQCSFHPRCYAEGLSGDCCPTLDGVLLGCCGNFWGTDDETEETANGLQSAGNGFSNKRLFAVTALLAALLGAW